MQQSDSQTTGNQDGIVAGKRTLGRVAMVFAICVVAVSICCSVFVALFATTVVNHPIHEISGPHPSVVYSQHIQANQIPASLQGIFGTLLGGWALIQGIVATKQNRGRAFGIVAIVAAVLGPILSYIVWSIVGSVDGHNVFGPQ